METTEQKPQYIWHEPTTSWKTQEEIAQCELEQQQELERQELEELRIREEELRIREEELRLEQEENDSPHKIFVHLDENGTILNVFHASREFMKKKPFGDGIYLENTYKIKNEPVVGGTYNQELNAFLPSKPYESWIFNIETWQWESPIPPPARNEPGPGKVYIAQYNAYILPSPDDTWIFNQEKLEFEPPTT